MLVANTYRPEQWHDFFVMVGGAAAALTGLVFVALSLNLDVIVRDVMHRSRSIGTLSNFGAIFVLCALALMGNQGHVAIGVEWLLVSTVAAIVFAYPWPTTRQASPGTPTLLRFTIGTSLYIAEIVGSVTVIVGSVAGVYIAAASMTLLAMYSVTGAWLLLVGARDRQE